MRIFKNYYKALAEWLTWLQCHPDTPSLWGLIPNQGAYKTQPVNASISGTTKQYFSPTPTPTSLSPSLPQDQLKKKNLVKKENHYRDCSTLDVQLLIPLKRHYIFMLLRLFILESFLH